MQIVVDSWEIVTQETIMNCFRKASITPEAQRAAIADPDDPL